MPLLFPILFLSVSSLAPDLQVSPRADCGSWQACRERALEAAARQDYEEFHNLAWRAVQRGPKDHPTLMTMLARAQSLSGRPGDALVMLDRLAAMGVITDAETSDDFRRVRALPGWPALEARISRGAPAAPVDSAPLREAAPRPSADTRKPPEPSPPHESAAAEAEALRFEATLFTPGGLAYDRVSNRFIVADRGAHKLAVIGERSRRLANLAGIETAGLENIAALAIDVREGDLWVVSADTSAGSSTLHKLQLISGRVLYSVQPEGIDRVNLADVAVTPRSTVLTVDSAAGRVFELPRRSRRLQTLTTLRVESPVSIAASSDDVAYVAHRDGLVRIDLGSRDAREVTGSKGTSLSGLAWIRSYGRSLIAVQRAGESAWQIVRLFPDATGKSIARTTILARDVDLTDARAVTVSGDTLFFVVRGSPQEAGEKIVKRVRLR